MRFVKMHGIGNDYVYADAVTRPEVLSGDLPALARAISDRHAGVGSDGLIFLCRPTVQGPDVRMRMFNADGSESEMCGNGVRCVAKFAHDRLGIRTRPMRVETGRGVLAIDYKTEGGKLVSATVDMGEPILELGRVPVRAEAVEALGEHRYRVKTPGDAWTATFVSMGNPHAVLFERGGKALTVEEVRGLELDRIGPRLERYPAFPRRINAHFVAVEGPGAATMRTWERGAGATLACGTGACAVLVAGVLTGRLDRWATLTLPGGELEIAWDEQSGRVSMTGPAQEVFEGEWPE